MRMAKATGRNAPVIKYDLLTALGALGCAGDKHMQRLTLRLMTLIVARYNWQTGELCVGQREMAALWSVDERTVKREMARLRDLGWLVQRRAAARGRVAVHGLDMPAILAATAPAWDRVGPDFAARMTGTDGAAPAAGNVINFPGVALADGPGPWSRMLAALKAENAALHAAWFAPLSPQPGPEGQLCLRAPSRFHATYVATHHLARLLAVARAEDPGLRSVAVTD